MSEHERWLQTLSAEELEAEYEAAKAAVRIALDRQSRMLCAMLKLWQACGIRACRRSRRCTHQSLGCQELLAQAGLPSARLRELAYELHQSKEVLDLTREPSGDPGIYLTGGSGDLPCPGFAAFPFTSEREGGSSIGHPMRFG